MFDVPAIVYTPTRVSDGEGSTEILGQGRVIWLDMKYHRNILEAVVQHDESVNVGDMIVLKE